PSGSATSSNNNTTISTKKELRKTPIINFKVFQKPDSFVSSFPFTSFNKRSISVNFGSFATDKPSFYYSFQHGPVIGWNKEAMLMADFREKIKTISSTKGSTAPEPAKRLGMGCLLIAVLAVSILTFFLAIGLFLNGNWIMGIVLSIFFLMSAMIALVLLFPHKFDSL